MSSKPTATDAELILKLYDLRRESEMRKARNWWLVDFWPQTADDFIKVANALGTQENNWLRQVGGYWEMAAALALHGALSEDLLLEPAVSGEMFVIYGKLHPFLNEVREKMQIPDIMANVERLIEGSEWARQRLQRVETRLAARRKAMAEATVAKAS